MSEMGQEPRFGDVRVTSALPLKADIDRKGRHVSNVPGTETRQGGSRPLKCPQWVVGESARLRRGAAVLDRIGLFQLGVGAFASGRRATKILEVHSSTISRL